MGPEGWAALISAGALVFGIFTWRSQSADQKRNAILAQAIKSLENAYDTLTNSGTAVPPPPGRLSWLTTARHLLRYQALRKKLTSYQEIICDEQEEHWRYRIYRAVEGLSTDANYFSQARLPVTDHHGPVELRSAVVVLAFAEWPEEKPDPIATVDVQRLMSQSKIVPLRYLHLDLEIKAYEQKYGSISQAK